jgi:uncharacterized protein
MNISLHNLYLLVAQKCNLSCTYCYANGGQFNGKPRMMDNDTMRVAVEKLLPLARNSIVVSFFGGEPLLNFKLIQKAVIYINSLAKDYNLRVSYALTTNGTVISDNIIEFIKEHIDYLAISLDGYEPITNKHRCFSNSQRSVHESVLSTLARLKKLGIHFSLRATITEYGMNDLLGTVNYFKNIGASSIRLAPVFESKIWSEDSLTTLSRELYAVNEDAMNRTMNNETTCYGEQFYRLHRFMKGECIDYPCDAGNGTLAISADGGIYPCDHFIDNNDYCMGNVNDEIWPSTESNEISERLKNNTVNNRPNCNHCDVRHICGGECHANSFFSMGSITTPSANHCALMHGLYRPLISSYQKLFASRITPSCLLHTDNKNG